MVATAMLVHGFATSDSTVSTRVSIFKGQRVNLSDSVSYRVILNHTYKKKKNIKTSAAIAYVAPIMSYRRMHDLIGLRKHSVIYYKKCYLGLILKRITLKITIYDIPFSHQ
jgi:hypothetical protein